MDTIFKISSYLKKHNKTITKAVLVLLITISIIFVNSTVYYKNCYDERTNEYQKLFDEQVELKSEYDNVSIENVELRQTLDTQNNEIKELKEQIDVLEKKSNSNKVSNNVSTNVNSNNVSSSSKLPNTKYPEATKLWNHLKANGLNDYVCAGIMGNIMSEVGGQTLDLSRWSTFDQTYYYGICQWAGDRKTRLINDFGTSFDAQIEFLTTELFEIIPKGSAFYSMNNAEDAALYFAKYYERCSSKYYAVRQQNAIKAYNYFVS